MCARVQRAMVGKGEAELGGGLGKVREKTHTVRQRKSEKQAEKQAHWLGEWGVKVSKVR